MEVSTLEWGITLAVTIGVLLFDVIVIARNPHEPSLKECATALSVYVGAAVAFGAWVWIYHGHDFGIEFYTGWLVEYSLSVDNLFVFIVLMAALKVPRKYQQEALMVGIILALIFRGIFIAVGYQLDRPLRLGLLHLRRVPRLHRRQLVQELPLPRGRAPGGQPDRQVRPEPPQRGRGVPRPEAVVARTTGPASSRRC